MREPSNVSTAARNPNVGHRQYLVTYSQADESKFSTREEFGEMLEAEINAVQSKIELQINIAFKSILVTSIISICLPA